VPLFTSARLFPSLYRPPGAESIAGKRIVPSMCSRSNHFAHFVDQQRGTFLACMVSGHQPVASLSTLRWCFWYVYGTTSRPFLHSAPRQGPDGTSNLRRSACPLVLTTSLRTPSTRSHSMRPFSRCVMTSQQRSHSDLVPAIDVKGDFRSDGTLRRDLTVLL
jgi:hypothetical protein